MAFYYAQKLNIKLSQSEMVGFLFCPKQGIKRLTHTEYKWQKK
nr:MAG TPA: hypothetical protein [Caudoviricetes sp.]